MLAYAALVSSHEMTKTARALHRAGDRIRGTVSRLYIIRRRTLVLLLSLKICVDVECALARYIDDDFTPTWKKKPKVFLESPISQYVIHVRAVF